MSKNAIYGYRIDDEYDYNFCGFLIVDGSRLEATDDPIQLPADRWQDQKFITNILTTKREEFINQAYVCGAIETKKVSEWFESL